MLDLTQLDVDYKIAPPESISIIGSNSIHTAGDLYVVNVNAISKQSNRHFKRMFDILSSLILLIISPAAIWLFRNKSQFLGNVLNVLKGNKSWVGYISEPGLFENLPVLKSGILNPANLFAELKLDTEKKSQLNMIYAKDYSITTDLEVMLKGWQNLDEK
jgi:lipopolysaccharide/colanic/teichoic acid biosynthesis glycosyltransferase